jgi:hypothetical protein
MKIICVIFGHRWSYDNMNALYCLRCKTCDWNAIACYWATQTEQWKARPLVPAVPNLPTRHTKTALDT